MTADYLCQCELHAPDSLHLRVSAPDGQEARLTSRVTLDPQQADLRRLVKQARHGQGTLRGWQELGEALYAGLFDPAAQAHLTNWRQRAADAGGRLHLQLEMDAQLPELNALPWEFLRQPATAGRPALWLAAEPAFTLTRRRLLETITISPQAPGPLDILVAIAAPADQGQVEYQPVVDQLLALAQKQPRRLAAPRVLNPASLESARRALAARPPQLFHFIGHGRLRAGGLGEIALVGPDGRLAQWVPDETFSALFNRPEIGCVILQACEGAASAAGRPLTGVAAQVAQRNIPLVLAFQFPISNHAALAFFKVFYEELLAGQAVAAAVQAARRGLVLRPGLEAQPDFAAAVLYMQGRPAGLFPEATAASGSQSAGRPQWPYSNHEALRLKIKGAFTLGDLELMCERLAEQIRADTGETHFTLSLDDLPGSNREMKIFHLIGTLDRREKLGYLIDAVQRQRPGLLDSDK